MNAVASAHLATIALYPVKSCAATNTEAWPVGPGGLAGDRSWMVVDAAGVFLTQRTLPALALVRPELVPGALQLRTPAGSVAVPVESGERRRVEVWGFNGTAIDAGDEAAALLSEHLDQPVRLVRCPEDFARSADPEAGTGVPVAFSDGFPLLVASMASLDDLNSRLDVPLPMDRFRPNLVVAGAPPWAEDGWRSIRIGKVSIDLVKPCSRCTVTTVDQQLGRFDGGEPLRTLRTFRRGERGVLFGVNAVARSAGTMTVGDAVELVG